MTLKNLYKAWGIALLAAFLVTGLYLYISIYNLPPDPAGDDDFAGLQYFVYAHSILVFCTGFFTALWIGFRSNSSNVGKPLAMTVFGVHSLGALLTILLVNYAWLYFMNPLGFAVFAALPYLCWTITTRQRKPKTLALVAFGILIWALLQAWNWYKVFTFKP